MLFNSYTFIFLFLPLTFFLYYYLLHQRLILAAKGLLIFASLFFYSWWNVVYLPIILSSMLFNYIVGNALSQKYGRTKIPRRTLLALGISANIALLGYFKYSDFLIENFNLLFDGSVQPLGLALPLAISFFTFQQIAYLVDSYRVETREYDFLNYALFVTFFPQLIAGPIVHHAEMMPQFASRWNLVKRYKNIAIGLFIFAIGLFKKVVIADTFATWATAGFDQAQTLYLIEAWVTSLSYTFQLYFDFSGYTDMAIGAALLFNIRLPDNFNSPYRARNIQEFWRRWHITLSRFLREYVYIPLGGNRKGPSRTYVNLLSTFVLGGIWHGAGWTFVFWGLLHGIAMIVQRLWHKTGITLPSILAWFITFNLINITWVFFRAREWGDAVKVLHAMFFGELVLDHKRQDALAFLSDHVSFGAWLQNIYAQDTTLVWVLAGSIIVLWPKNSQMLAETFTPTRLTLAVMSLLVTYALMDMNKVSEFLYFNF